MKTPEFFFQGEEFAWADSAYPVNVRTIPVHKEPASSIPRNTRFDKAVAHLRIRSEHCMGALKGRWQCLRGLRLEINCNADHIRACDWIMVCIILHNLIIDIEGSESGSAFQREHGRNEENEDLDGRAPQPVPYLYETDNSKRERLIDELFKRRSRRVQH